MAAVYIVIITILVGVTIYLGYLLSKVKKPIIGKAVIPQAIQESHVMEMLGESNAKGEEYKKLLTKSLKEKEAKISVNDEIKRRAIMEKKKIILGGIPLLLVSKKPYRVIGYDGSNYGNLKSIIFSSDGERMWVYFQKGEIVDIIGGKPMSDVVKSIDKKMRIVFIQYNKNKQLIPKRYVNS